MDSKRATEIYEEIGKFTIKLERDPASLGPKYLSDLICVGRNYTNKVSYFLLEIIREKQGLASELTAQEAAYAIESADLLVSDARVRAGVSIEDRKATISVLLRDRSRTINELKAELQNLDYVDKAVRHRHRELKDTMAEIRTQRSLIRDEIDTKSFYGDESTQVRGKGDPSKGSVLGIDVDELADLFASTPEVEVTAADLEPPAPDPDPVQTPDKIATGTFCPDCLEPQYRCSSGTSCPKGHGYGDPSDITERPSSTITPVVAPPAESFPPAELDISLDDEIAQIDAFLAEPLPSKKSDDDFDFESILANV